ncbi:cAMP-dependent protein kinase regulatory subunit [Paracoccidioides lutzii Pb01]|uniref:cAMP-dependent protein kinase regulatory subunit n=1 Tax=Paracoccidioides lutzii (strain ATCC MYA-826 / Pb01) TaxID=502779 RepID=C1HAQ8_PARBA|nr:cAMP-dependent protein kinase regulatory subunit [Paracoccidioides lutzii Pb01]EEH37469.2 cAMP-dependent protein kinase regulatory subunit [Paracoccidioides lutzii Pb01]
MARNMFPSPNPFGSGTSDVSKIEEEDEFISSPTQTNFHHTAPGHQYLAATSRSPTDHPAGPSGLSKSTSTSAAGGGGGGDAEADGDSFHRNPFSSVPQESHAPSSFPPSGTSTSTSTSTSPPDPSFPNNYALGRRTSVSAESLNPSNSGADSWIPPYHPKTPIQLSRLQKAVSTNFLFTHLDDEQFRTVLNALVEKPIPAKDIKVITQGDAGDFFYIVENGVFDVYINPAGSVQPGGAAGLGTKVTTIGPGGSFGELALMYNAPRAATVVSTVPKSTLWALDRITFRRILMDSAFQRRRMYEAFLEEVPLLSSLRPYERAKIADALDTVKHSAGSTIIKEGDPGNTFYLLESGEAEAFKQGIEGPVKHYKRGDYFGELSLLDEKPRAASVVAKTDVKVAQLGRDGFKRLLGSVEDIMRRAEYETAASNGGASNSTNESDSAQKGR